VLEKRGEEFSVVERKKEGIGDTRPKDIKRNTRRLVGSPVEGS